MSDKINTNQLFKDGYVKAGEYENMLDSLKWVYEYFINCHPEKYVLHMQVRAYQTCSRSRFQVRSDFGEVSNDLMSDSDKLGQS